MPAPAPAEPAPPLLDVLRRAYARSCRIRRLQLEPEKPAGSQRQQIRQLPDRREAGAPEHLLGDHTRVLREVELDGLRRAGRRARPLEVRGYGPRGDARAHPLPGDRGAAVSVDAGSPRVFLVPVEAGGYDMNVRRLDGARKGAEVPAWPALERA